MTGDFGVIDPREVLAARLSRQVDELLPLVGRQGGSGPQMEWFLDLLAGLSLAAESLHAMARNDTGAAEDHAVAALRMLDSVEAGLAVRPAGDHHQIS